MAEQSKKAFRFFDLPRELRDRVYTLALVGPSDVEFVSCISDDDDDTMRASHPDPKLRATWVSRSLKMTYRLDRGKKCMCGVCPEAPRPQLQLFKVSRTVYEESREVFYAQNSFGFDMGSGVGCNRFFADREYALKYIRKVTLDIAFHTGDFSHSYWTDREYKILFRTLKEKTALRHLTLNSHGLLPDVSGDKWTCTCDCAVFENPIFAMGAVLGINDLPQSKVSRTHDREWALIKSLTTINDLPRLSINLDFCYHMLDHDAHADVIFEHDHLREFVAYMRKNMLRNGAKLEGTQIQGFCRSPDNEERRYRFHSDDDEFGKSYLKAFKDPYDATNHAPHDDSGSEPDEDDSLPDLEDPSDGAEWEDDDDDSDLDSMPGLEGDSDDIDDIEEDGEEEDVDDDDDGVD